MYGGRSILGQLTHQTETRKFICISKSITVFFYDKNNGIKWDTKTIFLLFCLPSFYRSKVSVI